MKTLLLLIVAISLITVDGEVDDRGRYPTTHILIQNQLGDGISTVNVHCKDVKYGDDRGDQSVRDAQDYEFHFTPSPTYFPVFYCHFTSGKGIVYQKVYNYKRDYNRCFKHCKFIIHQDGIYGINGKDEADLMWLWQPPPKLI